MSVGDDGVERRSEEPARPGLDEGVPCSLLWEVVLCVRFWGFIFGVPEVFKTILFGNYA